MTAPQILRLTLSAGLVALALALVSEGASRGCAAGTGEAVTAGLAYGRVGVAALLLPLAFARPRWWVATLVFYAVTFPAQYFVFGVGCSA